MNKYKSIIVLTLSVLICSVAIYIVNLFTGGLKWKEF